jgi:acetyltransferase-like isoleucine patch superfamily enzyme
MVENRSNSVGDVKTMMLSLRRYIANHMIGCLPATRLYRFKTLIWRAAGIDIASSAKLVSSVRIWTSGYVSIGADTFVGHDVMIVGGDAPVHIGARCDIAPRVLLVTGTHLDGGIDRAAGQGLSRPVMIRDGAWIGSASTILGGVVIGECAVIGAGSIVNKSIPENMVAFGTPCRPIKLRPFHADI